MDPRKEDADVKTAPAPEAPARPAPGACITLLFVLYSVSFNFSKTHKIHKASFCLRPWLAQIFKLFYRSLVLLAALTPL